MSYIDFHSPSGPRWYGPELSPPDETLRWMEGRGVAQPVAPSGALKRPFMTCANLSGDLVAGSAHDAATRDSESGRGSLQRCQQRLPLAADLLVQGRETLRIELTGKMAWPADVHEGIACGNAQGY